MTACTTVRHPVSRLRGEGLLLIDKTFTRKRHTALAVSQQERAVAQFRHIRTTKVLKVL